MDRTQNTTASPTATTAVAPLTPVLSAKYALTAGQFGVVAMVALWCLYLSYLPLFHSLTWHEILVGQWVLAHQALPTIDPTLPLADGISWSAPGWLSGVLFALAERHGGPLMLSGVLVGAVGGATILLATLFFGCAGRKRWMVIGVVTVLAFAAGRIGVLRSELLGWLCFAALLPLERRFAQRPTAWLGVALALLMAVWSNLDGTFIVGVLVLVSSGFGALIDGWIDRGRLTEAVGDPALRQRVWFYELAVAATLLHPLGWNVWAQVAQFPRSPLWQQLGGWQPLLFTTWTGLGCAAIWLVGAVLLRWSPRRFDAGQVLMLGGMSALVAVNSLLAPWFAVVALVVLLPHMAHLFTARRWIRPARVREMPAMGESAQSLQFVFTLLSVLVIWVAFALSPLASPLLGGKPRPITQVYSKKAPHALAKYLRENAPRGLVWAPEDLGDWLQWDGPDGLKVAANSNVAALPPMVRFDFAQVYRGEGSWTRTLDRYGVELLVIDKERHERLADAALGAGDDWTTVFEDGRLLVMQRREVRG